MREVSDIVIAVGRVGNDGCPDPDLEILCLFCVRQILEIVLDLAISDTCPILVLFIVK